ncbi:MAG: hypothetical protein V3S29_06070 [bacterium]
MGWFESIRKYTWNETTTPYFVPVQKLNRTQAGKELFVYTLFLLILFGVLALVSCGGKSNEGDFFSIVVSAHAFTVFCAALLLGVRKSPAAALYCVSAPVASFVFALVTKLQLGRGSLADYVFLGFTVLWFFYSRRVYAIAKAYAGLPEMDRTP